MVLKRVYRFAHWIPYKFEKLKHSYFVQKENRGILAPFAKQEWENNIKDDINKKENEDVKDRSLWRKKLHSWPTLWGIRRKKIVSKPRPTQHSNFLHSPIKTHQYNYQYTNIFNILYDKYTVYFVLFCTSHAPFNYIITWYRVFIIYF